MTQPVHQGGGISSRARGFTIIELLVVMAVLGLLLSIVAPRYTEHVDRAREVVLRQNLQAMREAIDKFYADRARYPKDLQELVAQHYLRQIPVDPITDKADTWVVLSPQGAKSTTPNDGVLFDVRSGANGVAKDGTAYAKW